MSGDRRFQCQRHLLLVAAMLALAGPPAGAWEGPFQISGDPQAITPCMATDGTGNWVASWGSFRWDGGIAADYRVQVANSSDNAATWSPPAMMPAPDPGNPLDFRDPCVTYSPQGSWLLAWASTGYGAGTGIHVSSSSDNGAAWAEATRISDARWARQPRVSGNQNGGALAAWHREEPGGGVMVAARAAGDLTTWTAQSDFGWESGSYGIEASDAAVDGAGVAVAVWARMFSWTSGPPYYHFYYDHDFVVSRSTNSGDTWTTVGTGSVFSYTGLSPHHDLRLFKDGRGLWLIVWSNEHDILLSRSTDAGATWSNRSPIYGTGYNVQPSLATDGAGNWLAVWRGGTSLMCSQSSDNASTWSVAAPLVVNGAAVSGTDPQVAHGMDGRWVVMWCGGSVQYAYDDTLFAAAAAATDWSVYE